MKIDERSAANRASGLVALVVVVVVVLLAATTVLWARERMRT